MNVFYIIILYHTIHSFQIYCFTEHTIQTLLEKQKDLHVIVSSQEMSPQVKQEIQEKVASLHQECRQLNEQITDYQNEVYKIDIDLVKKRNEVNFNFNSFIN